MAVTNLNGNTVQVRGFVPAHQQTPSAIPQSPRTPVKSTSGGNLFYNAPVLTTAGLVAKAGTTTTSKISGHILYMFGPDGGEVQNIPDNCGTGYTVIYDTLGSAGQWITHVSTAAYATTDIGKCYCSTDESATTGTNRYTSPGDAYTNRCIDGATEDNSAGQYQVVGIGGYERSDAGVAGTLVIVRYNTSIYSAGEAS